MRQLNLWPSLSAWLARWSMRGKQHKANARVACACARVREARDAHDTRRIHQEEQQALRARLYALALEQGRIR